MIYQQLGPSGLTVSVVGLGCNNFGARMADEDVPTVVGAAIDAGITLFDTADVYGNAGGSETLLGEALQGRRDEVVIATKFGMDMGGANGPDWGVRGSRRYIRIAVENSLRRLGTDWIDLYQLHRPDPHTPIEETLAALSELVTEGKVRYIGSSNLTGWQVVDADWTARSGGYEAFISAQNEYSWLNREVETELVPALEHTGQGLLPFFPLAARSADRQVPTRGERTGRHQAGVAVRRAGVGRLRHRRGAPVLRRRARTDPAPDRDRRAGRDADGRLRHRRRHQGVPDRGQRGGRAVAADGRRPADADGAHRLTP